jgi:chemotaxis protein MotB
LAVLTEYTGPDLNKDGRDIVIVLAQELGKLPNGPAIEGHTDARSSSNGNNYSNWELSADRTNVARRLMQTNGVTETQVAQLRGFTDQRLRNQTSPLDPSNRRVSEIVQYLVKPGTEDTSVAGAGDGVRAATPAAPPH